ncbi:MAG: bifunctional (p)ppGpp synthetase/guanosine-3',5'-bis(diphosphate) 3'-pyrophosphohydrolase [Chitinophagales bacterium]|nr:bifunctional (p)ppGpp synthetase/guanosine-3',5'-bis(diphosphate) 3'-pyrophosphohydrolase [Chitinophagales bacterium]
MLVIDEEKERKEIIKDYRQLLRLARPRMQKGDDKRIRHAFEMAVEAHKTQRRKSGEPYIHHPIAVAKIVAEDIGLDTNAVICALLHDTVEDTDVTLDQIKREFGETIAKIIDGLTKIDQISHQTLSSQAENYRKILITLSDDIRVILIKIADRLHNMRTLEGVSKKNQIKTASETLYLYAPLAHRLGLYNIKGELEDLAMKYLEPEKYKEIAKLLEDTKRERNKYINDFIKPIADELEKAGLKARVFGRPKSISSIWNKMKKKGVDFDDVYDKFAIRIVLDVPNKEDELSESFKAFSIVTNKYTANDKRFRNNISKPKSNGYESLHTTVMGPKGRWVEIQIRTERMDEVAEKGLAAHFNYKEGKTTVVNTNVYEEATEKWLLQVRELIKNSNENPLDFVNDFKLELYHKEIYVFTPKGEMRLLPIGATALDFAYDIHTNVGNTTIGAKVNNKLVPISYVLNNGDQVEIITSKKTIANEDWLKFVGTSKAKNKIKDALKEEKRRIAEDGKEILYRKLKKQKINQTDENIQALVQFYKVHSPLDLYYLVGTDDKFLNNISDVPNNGGVLEVAKPKSVRKEKLQRAEVDEYKEQQDKAKNLELVIYDNDNQRIPFEYANCCNPIPGDDVSGFLTIDGVIKVHRTSCNNLINLASRHANRIVNTRWKVKEAPFLTKINVTGLDNMGVIAKLTRVISQNMKLNMKSIFLESKDGVFEGYIEVFVRNNDQLKKLLENINNLKGLISAKRELD